MGDRKKSRETALLAGKAAVHPHVSSHAIVRYCQRVLGVHPLVTGAYSEAELARIHVAAAGRASPKEIIAEILTPAVLVAIGAGFTIFGTRRFTVVAAPGGTIRTIETPYATRPDKLRHMSRVEARDRLQREELRYYASGGRI